jgi:2-amino-4-hydroxy-6-hydroxymethyldihydropteridine diphosphokinase
MRRTAIGIGSNVGDRLANVRKAVRAIAERVGTVSAASDVYETPPWGVESQPRFLNACVVAETTLAPMELLSELKEIEQALGRKKRGRWGPREIDLDILLYEGVEMDEESLSIPHPCMGERAFVLVPLAAIAPDFVLAATGKTIAELLRALPDDAARGIVRIAGI